MDDLFVIKIGGQVIDDEVKLDQALAGFAKLKGPKILVHGGGKIANTLLDRMGIDKQLVDGRRITNLESLHVVQMVYAGLVNKNIVAKLQSLDCMSLGLTGADVNCIKAVKRPVKEIDYGYVGDVTEVNSTILTTLIEQKLIPVICSLTHDGQGQILNTNADTIATEVGIAMTRNFKVSLIYCFEQNGVLMSMEDQQSVIKNLHPVYYQQLKAAGKINKGMIPKLDNAFRALGHGVNRVYVTHYQTLEDLTNLDSLLATRISLFDKNE
jgi:acetylglutamate kinase